MKLYALLSTLFLVMASVGGALADNRERLTVALPGNAKSLWVSDNHLGVELSDGRLLGFKFAGGKLVKTAKVPTRDTSPNPKEALPDGVVGEGAQDIRKAWLTGPTKRYAHGVLGDRIEASGLKVETATGDITEFILPPSEVFEDRFARVVDLERNGRSAVVVVNSDLDLGAALAVFGVQNGTLERLARTPFIGMSNRWLNPAGIADFDGNGTPEIAIVVTPHIGGTLQFWELQKGKLVLRAEKYGFSNHFIGSRVQEMSATVYAPERRSPLLVLPGADRKSLLGVAHHKGKISVKWTLDLLAKVVTEVVVLGGKPESPAIVAGLSNKTLIILH